MLIANAVTLLRGRARSSRTAVAALVLALLPVVSVLSGPAGQGSSPAGTPTPAPASSRTSAVADGPDPQVLAISVDGLNPAALQVLGRRRAPHLWRLVDQGASTLDARTQRELTTTLPNHTSMVTGRRIDATRGGHGVTWNDDEPGHPPTVSDAAGEAVGSVFQVAHDAGLSSAVFATKTKFSLFERSWPAAVDRFVVRDQGDEELVRAARRDLLRRDRAVTLLHLGRADQVGHESGFLSRPYLGAVRRVDDLLGTVLDDVDSRPALADVTIVLTADHGGPRGSTDHGDARLLANHRVPFLVWGPGVRAADLYDLNPGRRDPGDRRTGLQGPQPVRNGDLANVVTGLLGLDPVPGSRFGASDPLRLSRARRR